MAETNQGITEEEFFARMPDPQTSQAVRRLMEVAEENGGRVSWGKQGLSIRSRRRNFPGWSNQVSVAWIYPPGVETWMTCKDFSFGAGAGKRGRFGGVPHYLREFLENWANSFAGLPYADRVPSESIIAYTVPHAAAIHHIDDLAERLKNVLAALQTLAPA